MRSALLLVRKDAAAGEARAVADAKALARAAPDTQRLQVCIAVDRPLAYIYAWSEKPASHDGAKRLAPIAEWPGASAGAQAPYHYVVATDIEPGWEDELGEAREFDDLPKEAQRYVRFLEELGEVPVSVVSVGPSREQSLAVVA